MRLSMGKFMPYLEKSGWTVAYQGMEGDQYSKNGHFVSIDVEGSFDFFEHAAKIIAEADGKTLDQFWIEMFEAYNDKYALKEPISFDMMDKD